MEKIEEQELRVQGEPVQSKEENQEKSLEKLLQEIQENADPKCSKCYGRGYRGIARGNPPQPVLCQCVMKVMAKKDEERKQQEQKEIQEKIAAEAAKNLAQKIDSEVTEQIVEAASVS